MAKAERFFLKMPAELRPTIARFIWRAFGRPMTVQERVAKHRAARNTHVTGSVTLPLSSGVTVALSPSETSPLHGSPSTTPPPRIPVSASKNRKNEAVELLNYLNLKANRSFRPVETTLRYIRARLESGVSVEDMKAVINRQVSEWKGTEMEKFLRPETLFNATKFESYLGQKQVAKVSFSSGSSVTFLDKELTPEQYAEVHEQIKGLVKQLAEAEQYAEVQQIKGVVKQLAEDKKA